MSHAFTTDGNAVAPPDVMAEQCETDPYLPAEAPPPQNTPQA